MESKTTAKIPKSSKKCDHVMQPSPNIHAMFSASTPKNSRAARTAYGGGFHEQHKGFASGQPPMR
eukprot:1349340-Amphidinium_carterae.1